MWQRLTRRSHRTVELANLQKIFNMLILLTVLNLLATATVFGVLGYALQQRSLMNETIDSQTKLKTLYMTLSDTESSQRGYIITGDQGYVASYYENAAQVRAALADVRQIQRSPADDASIKKIITLSQKKLDEMQSTLEVRQRDGLSAASILVGMHLGANLMAENRQQMSAANEAMDNDIVAKRTAVTAMTSAVLGVLAINLLATLATAIASYRLSRRIQENYDNLLNVSRSKDEFLAIASRQLRTPATAVKQYLSLSLDGFAGTFTPAQRDLIVKANANNERQIAIVNDILQITKLDLNAIHVAKDEHHMSRIVRHAVEDMRSRVDASGHTIVVKRLPKQEDTVFVDPSLMKSVLENLIDNASKYSAADTKITISMKVVDNHVLTSVTDEGVGIHPDDHPKLFRKFSRIENEYSIVAGGTGLGLYWCREVVALHDGTISIDSRLEEGSTFTIDLPAVIE